jgi:hypothetical protein
MKRVAVLAVVLGAGMAANAQVLNFGSTGVLAGGGAFMEQVFNLGGSGDITGFRITGDMLTAGGNSWQADMRLTIIAPNMATFDIGGFSSGLPSWSASTTGPSVPGNTASPGPLDASADFAFGNVAGAWTVRLSNGWPSAAVTDTLQWDNVVITLIPAPGAAALLGMGGLVALRRRR